jgi:hypothetical protein
LSGFQIRDANRVIVRVGDEEFAAGDRYSGRLVKRRFRAVRLTGFARAEKRLDSSFT